MKKTTAPPLTPEQTEALRVQVAEQMAQAARRDAEKAWARAKNSRSFDELRTEVVTLLRTGAPAGPLRRVPSAEERDTLSVEVERGWACGATLYVHFDYQPFSSRVVNPDNPDEALIPVVGRVEISWSSTGRSVVAALAACDLYREMVSLGAQVQMLLDRRDTYRPF